MLNTALAILKILASTIFIVLSFVMLALTPKAEQIKQECIKAEHQIKHNLNNLYNAGSIIASAIITAILASPTNKKPIWLKLMKFTAFAKYDILYGPLRSLVLSLSDLKNSIKQIKH